MDWFLYDRDLRHEKVIFYHSRRDMRLNEISRFSLTFEAPIPQNGQTHLNNSSQIADELFECV